MTTTIYASFADAANAEKAAGALLDYGVQAEDLNLVRQGEATSGTTEYVSTNPSMEGTMGAASTNYVAGTSQAIDSDYDNLAARDTDEASDSEKAAKSGISTTTGGDAVAGAAKGAGIGLGVGVLAALAAIFVPGIGLVAGGGALGVAISGAVATAGAGAAAGAVTGYLKDQGVDANVAEDYERAIVNGGALIAVQVPSGKVDESSVRSILDKYAASSVTNSFINSSGGYVA